MLANQKVRSQEFDPESSSTYFLLSCANLHEFLHRNYQEKHEFKTREVHEKWS